MKEYRVAKTLLAIGFLTLFLFQGCEYDGPDQIWKPDQPLGTIPVILRVEPENSAGAQEIKLIGENFSPVMEENTVYINGEQVPIKSATANEIILRRPEIAGDSLRIQVLISGMAIIAEYYPYKLGEARVELGSFLETDEVRALAIDAEGNIYGMNRTIVQKVTPELAKSDYGVQAFRGRTSAMRIGPDGVLYIQKRGNTILYKIPPGGGDTEEFTTLPKQVKYFDFDQNINIISGGDKSGLVVVHLDGTSAATDHYSDFNIQAVRVFNEYVYVVAQYVGSDPSVPILGIWRNEITSSTGDLAEGELVFDWANSGNYSESAINDITFALDGDMYVGTDYDDPILIIHPDGTTEPLYEGLLIPTASHLVWGNGDYLYMNRYNISGEIRRLVRLEIGKPGAPYYGRR